MILIGRGLDLGEEAIENREKAKGETRSGLEREVRDAGPGTGKPKPETSEEKVCGRMSEESSERLGQA